MAIIGIDFVGLLPLSKNQTGAFDMICVIIVHFSSMVHLVLSLQTYKAKGFAKIMFENCYKLHRLPEHIISDWDSLFMSIFWPHLHQLIGIELWMSTTYHLRQMVPQKGPIAL
jgi:hypothetical protein